MWGNIQSYKSDKILYPKYIVKITNTCKLENDKQINENMKKKKLPPESQWLHFRKQGNTRLVCYT